MNIVSETYLTCPVCNFRQKANIPEDSCQYFYECVNCHTVIKRKPGDCCVFCSYGEHPCIPKQKEQH